MSDVFKQFSDEEINSNKKQENDISRLDGISVKVEAILGETKMYINDILNISEGTIIEFDKDLNDPFDIVVSGKLIAKGEVVAIDEKLGIRITKILKSK